MTTLHVAPNPFNSPSSRDIVTTYANLFRKGFGCYRSDPHQPKRSPQRFRVRTESSSMANSDDDWHIRGFMEWPDDEPKRLNKRRRSLMESDSDDDEIMATEMVDRQEKVAASGAAAFRNQLADLDPSQIQPNISPSTSLPNAFSVLKPTNVQIPGRSLMTNFSLQKDEEERKKKVAIAHDSSARQTSLPPLPPLKPFNPDEVDLRPTDDNGMPQNHPVDSSMQSQPFAGQNPHIPFDQETLAQDAHWRVSETDPELNLPDSHHESFTATTSAVASAASGMTGMSHSAWENPPVGMGGEGDGLVTVATGLKSLEPGIHSGASGPDSQVPGGWGTPTAVFDPDTWAVAGPNDQDCSLFEDKCAFCLRNNDSWPPERVPSQAISQCQSCPVNLCLECRAICPQCGKGFCLPCASKGDTSGVCKECAARR